MAKQIRCYPHELTELRQKHAGLVCAVIRKQQAESDKANTAEFRTATRASINKLRCKLDGMHFAFNLISDLFTVDVELFQPGGATPARSFITS